MEEKVSYIPEPRRFPAVHIARGSRLHLDVFFFRQLQSCNFADFLGTQRVNNPPCESRTPTFSL